ncbi:Hypothetical predicted protein [Cloeon dipterum]|uniref:Septin-type G domain-containing protein n=1 Tax=Cloeon dipterum TaxID=197152 RepID=A0A8S1BTN8_9INSE|nr:Hypothetical predicted protein [Cloeon dipterum]
MRRSPSPTADPGKSPIPPPRSPVGSYGHYKAVQPRLGPLSSTYLPATNLPRQTYASALSGMPFQPLGRPIQYIKPPRSTPLPASEGPTRPTTLQPSPGVSEERALTPGHRAPSPSFMDPNYCLCCPPNDLRFSDALRAKPRVPLRRSFIVGGDSDRDYIGFATLPEQVHRKSVKRGFEFTLMVVGESGLGKSTLVNSLFLSDLYNDRVIPDVSDLVARTTAISKQTMDIEERGVRLRLSVVDTPGFGDALDCDDSWRAVCTYVEQQFSQYFQDESGLHRKNIQDNRIHCCLYFIPPYGHGLRQLDVEFMKRLQNKVNLVPVIAKADTLTPTELKRLKDRVIADLEENNVQIYQFPDCDSDEDDEFKKQDEELKKKVRGRQYAWGVVEVDNPQHSDFARLRSFLVSTHMQDLKDVTHDLHYEAFRAHCIAQISQQAIKERKGKRDSSGPVLDIGTETDRLLLQKDEEIRRMQEMLAQMQHKLQKQSSTGSQGNLLDELAVPPNQNQRDSVVDV